MCAVILTAPQRRDLIGAYDREVLEGRIRRTASDSVKLTQWFLQIGYFGHQMVVPVWASQVEALLRFCDRNDFAWLAVKILQAAERRSALKEVA